LGQEGQVNFQTSASLENRKDGDWINYAKKGIDILENTTQIAGHKPSQDTLLAILRKSVESNPQFK